MASPAPARKKLTETEAAQRLVKAMDRHLSALHPKERKEVEKKFLRGPSRGNRAK